jgi:type IV secretory pathway VirB2 component (pilin)
MENIMRKPISVAASMDLAAIYRFSLLSLLTAVLYMISCAQAFASINPTEIGTVLCNATAIIMMDVGQGLATLAVVALGVGALFGKVTWGMALTTVTGIGTIFGAVGIVGWLTQSFLPLIASISCAVGGAGCVLNLITGASC